MTTQANISNYLSMMEKREVSVLRQAFNFEKTYWEVHYKARSPQCTMYLEYNDSYLYIQTDLALLALPRIVFFPYIFIC